MSNENFTGRESLKTDTPVILLLRKYGVYALPVFAVVLLTLLNRNYQMDDALIYLRYVQNFQNGLGLVYNPEEYFNGITSPLYLALLILLSYVISDLQFAAMLLSGMSLLGAAIIGGKIFSRSHVEASLAALFIGTFGFFYFNFGMESMLFLFLIGLSLYLYKLNSDYFVVILSLVALTRIEGALLGIIMMADYFYRHHRLPSLKLLILAAGLFLLPWVFNYWYFGEWLPATGEAKVGQGQSGLWGEGLLFLQVWSHYYLAFNGSQVAMVAMAVFLLIGLLGLKQSRVAWISLFFGLALFAVYTFVNIPNYNWYYAPFYYLALLFTWRGFWSVFSGDFALRSPAQARWLLPLGSSVVMIFLVNAALSLSLQPKGPIPHYQTIGTWLAENTPSDSSIGLVEIGTVGWYSKRHIVDILGLVTANNAGHIGRKEFYDWLLYSQPDYLLRHEPPTAHEASITFLEDNGFYQTVESFDYAGFLLLAKSKSVSDQQIADQALRKKNSQQRFAQIVAANGQSTAEFQLQPHRLFAHAPTQFSTTLQIERDSFEITYGITEMFTGMHGGVCFYIDQLPEDEPLLSDCIDPSANSEAMSRSQTIELARGGEHMLRFRTECIESCNYAQSYWKDLYL